MNTQSTNERGWLPSASSAQRYALCPGSFLLEQQCPTGETSADAELGNRIHAALAGEKVELSDDEQELVNACFRKECELVRSVFGFNQSVIPNVRERRLWFINDDFERTWSGKPDVVYINKSAALVIDYKTGRGDVESAEGNMQLRCLAVLAFACYAVNEITVAIIQPLAGQPSACHYTAADLAKATEEIENLMARVKLPGQPRNPSEAACKYCRAKAICQEARGTLETLHNPERSVASLTGDELAEYLTRLPLIENVIDALRTEAKRRIGNGDSVPGWKLESGDERDTITKPETVFARFCQIGGTSEQFMSTVKVAKGKLKSAVKSATGAKGKELDAKLDQILDGCTESKQSAASLVAEK
jgi:hypothetical protein